MARTPLGMPAVAEQTLYSKALSGVNIVLFLKLRFLSAVMSRARFMMALSDVKCRIFSEVGFYAFCSHPQ